MHPWVPFPAVVTPAASERSVPMWLEADVCAAKQQRGAAKWASVWICGCQRGVIFIYFPDFCSISLQNIQTPCLFSDVRSLRVFFLLVLVLNWWHARHIGPLVKRQGTPMDTSLRCCIHVVGMGESVQKLGWIWWPLTRRDMTLHVIHGFLISSQLPKWRNAQLTHQDSPNARRMSYKCGTHQCCFWWPSQNQSAFFKDGEFLCLILSTKMTGHSLRKVSRLWWTFVGGHAQAFFSWYFRIPMAIL